MLGGAIPPVKDPGAQESDLLCKTFPGLTETLGPGLGVLEALSTCAIW